MDTSFPSTSRSKSTGSLGSGNLVENYFKTTNCIYDLSKHKHDKSEATRNLRADKDAKKEEEKIDITDNEFIENEQEMVESLDPAKKSSIESHDPTILPDNVKVESLEPARKSSTESHDPTILPDNVIATHESNGNSSLKSAGQRPISGIRPEEEHRVHRRLISPGVFTKNIYAQADSMFNLTHTMGMSPKTRRRDIGYISGKSGINPFLGNNDDEENLEPCEKVYYYYSSDPETDSLQGENGSGVKFSLGDTDSEIEIHHSGSSDSCSEKGALKSILRNKDGGHASLPPQRHSHVHFTRNASDSSNS